MCVCVCECICICVCMYIYVSCLTHTALWYVPLSWFGHFSIPTWLTFILKTMTIRISFPQLTCVCWPIHHHSDTLHLWLGCFIEPANTEKARLWWTFFIVTCLRFSDFKLMTAQWSGWIMCWWHNINKKLVNDVSLFPHSSSALGTVNHTVKYTLSSISQYHSKAHNLHHQLLHQDEH